MNTNPKSAGLQQSRIKKHIEELDSYRFFNLLTGPKLFSIVEKLLPKYRERSYPPTETLSMFLSQTMSADRSCQNIANKMAVKRIDNRLLVHNTHTGSYCIARQRLPVSLISELVRCTGKLIEEQLPVHWCLQGRPVKLVNGTTVTMPDTLKNQEAYPRQRGQKAGLGFPICRIVGIISLASGTVLDAAIGPYKGKGANEQTLFRGRLDSFDAADIVLGDAFFSTYFFLAEFIARGVDAVLSKMGHEKSRLIFARDKNWVGKIIWSPMRG
ncbi:MAG: hypothetical protein P8Y45_19240 [Exilibacterium sp.]